MPEAAPGTQPDFRCLTEGLVYTSETDAPVEPVHWARDGAGGALSKDEVLRLAGRPSSSRVTTGSVRAFFRPVSEEADWQNEEEREAARRFRELADALEKLKGAKVYRIGENPMDVYVLGLTKEGDIVGVKTRVVET